METKDEFEELLHIIVPVLQKMKSPLSVTYLNILLSQLGIKGSIDEPFMNLYREQFIFYVLGDDIKIILREPENSSINVEKEKVDKLLKILDKNLKKLDTIKRCMKTDMELEKFIEQFSSNKYAVNLPFLLRNSDYLQLYLKGEETLVKLVDGTNSEEITEDKFWKNMENEGLQKIVFERLVNLYRKLRKSLHHGLLQSCYNFGNVLIDKKFMKEYKDYFEKEGECAFRLKDDRSTVVSEQESAKPIKSSDSDKLLCNKGKPFLKGLFTNKNFLIMSLALTGFTLNVFLKIMRN